MNELVWRDRTSIPVTATAPTPEHRPLSAARRDPLKPVAAGSAWGMLFDQRWFHLTVPRAGRSNQPRYLEWRDQGEATLYVDGTPYYGFDVAHRYVALPDQTREVWVEGYCCQTAIWHPEATGLSSKGSTFTGAFLLHRDDEAWETLHDLRALFDLMMHVRSRQTPAPPAGLSRFGQQPTVEQAAPLYRKILHLLDGALDAFDLEGIAALKSKLAIARGELKDDRPLLRAALTGHAHIDLVWLWPERIGEAKAVHTFATVDRLIALYPEFRFAYSQPASYRAVSRRSPKLATKVNRHIDSGAWEATGALDVESDTVLPCGEALARSFFLGQAEFEKLRGSPARLLWLPDVFGYSGCLPQLMRLAGVEWFFTTKLTWSAVNRFPYSSFIWRGTDGSEVIAHVTQNVGYNNRLDLAELDANACGHSQSHLHSEFLHPTGYGDGGGGPTEEMCERARRLSGLAGTPELRWAHPEQFFAGLAENRDSLPVYQGECYLEYHRGTYTTHGNLKAAFRSLERALQIREAVAAATHENPDLAETWRRLVFAQFHDFIPGSSIAEVYAEGVEELKRLAKEQLAAARKRLTRATGQWQVFNPHPLPWRGWLDVPGEKSPRQFEVPALASLPAAAAIESQDEVIVRDRQLMSDRVCVDFTAGGSIGSLTIDGREIALTGAAAVPFLYPDRPANYDAWDIDRHTLALGKAVDSPPNISCIQMSPYRGAILVTRKLGQASTLTLRFDLRAGEPLLRLTASIDWHESHTLLRLHFPTAYRGRSARFGSPFGSTLRVQQPGDPLAEAQWEVPGSRWAAVCGDGETEGLSLITDSKYGFSAKAGEMTVSLVRSARITGCDDFRYAAPDGLSRHRPESPFCDQGHHEIELALAHYSITGPQELHPAALAETLFTSPLVYRGRPVSSGFGSVVGAPSLLPVWAKPLRPDAWLLRLHEVSGLRGVAHLDLRPGWQVRACELDGKPKQSAPQVSFLYGPYEIVSLLCEHVPT